MLFRLQQLLYFGRLRRPCSATNYLRHRTWVDSHSARTALLGHDSGRRSIHGAAIPYQSDHDYHASLTSSLSDNDDGTPPSNSTAEYSPWSDSSDPEAGDGDSGPLSHFAFLALAFQDFSTKRFRRLADTHFPDNRRPGSVPSRLVPDDQNWYQASNTRQIIDLDAYEVSALPRQLLSAQILSRYSSQTLVSRQDWARCLFRIAIEQYRALDIGGPSQDPDYQATCYQQFGQMLELLHLWNVFFQVYQLPNESQEVPLKAAIDHIANDLSHSSSYQERLLAFAPQWHLHSDPESDQHVVFSSFITLTVLAKIRHRLLGSIELGIGGRGISAAQGSFLNIRNVSPPEAIFMHMVGRAAQSAPLNRIYLRVGLSQLGFTSDESQSFGRTVEYLHSHPEYLLSEAERCLSSLGHDIFEGDATKQAEHLKQTRDLYEMARDRDDARDAALAPVSFLAWIENAEPDALRQFRQVFRQVTKDTIIEPGRSILDAILRRTLAYTPASHPHVNVADEISQILGTWLSVSRRKISAVLAKALLSRFRDNNDSRGFMKVWVVLQRFRTNVTPVDEDDVASWVADLIKNSRYGAAIEVHKRALIALVGVTRPPESQRRETALILTDRCLSHCGGPLAQPAKARFLIENYMRCGWATQRHLWRLRIRLSLYTGNSPGFLGALQRYNDLSTEWKPLDQESVLLFRRRLRTISVNECTPIVPILRVVSRAIALWHGETRARPYIDDPAYFAPPDAWEGLVEAHAGLLTDLRHFDVVPDRLRIAACIHKHLLQCVPKDLLPENLTSEVAKMEALIDRTFWDANHRERMSLLGKQVYNVGPEKEYTEMPIVLELNLVTRWLIHALRSRRLLNFDLGTRRFPDLGSHIKHLLWEANQDIAPLPLTEGRKAEDSAEPVRSGSRRLKPSDTSRIQYLKGLLDSLQELEASRSRLEAAGQIEDKMVATRAPAYLSYFRGIRTSRPVPLPPESVPSLSRRERVMLTREMGYVPDAWKRRIVSPKARRRHRVATKKTRTAYIRKLFTPVRLVPYPLPPTEILSTAERIRLRQERKRLKPASFFTGEASIITAYRTGPRSPVRRIYATGSQRQLSKANRLT